MKLNLTQPPSLSLFHHIQAAIIAGGGTVSDFAKYQGVSAQCIRVCLTGANTGSVAERIREAAIKFAYKINKVKN